MDYPTYLTFPVLVLSMILARKHDSAMWFLSTLLLVEIIDLVMHDISMTWTTHYYIWCVFVNVIFFIAVIYRKTLSAHLYNLTQIDYFKRAFINHSFSIQEGAMLCIFFASLIINLITYIEVLLYKYYVIDTAYIKLYVRDGVQVALHIFMALAALSFSTLRAKDYEEAIQ